MCKYFCSLLILSVCFSSSCLAEDPWGKDAEMTQVVSLSPPKRPAYNAFLVSLINFHQQVISKADGPRSHYYPGSSEYTKQAIIKYGFFRGYIMGCDRLMRENGELWTYPRRYIWHEWKKYDPVK